jgi:arylsulfatase A-like enzyme
MADYVTLDVTHKYEPAQIDAIRTDLNPRLVVPNPPPPELYNIRTDPQEQVNLATTEPDRTRRMLAELESWFETVERDRTRTHNT